MGHFTPFLSLPPLSISKISRYIAPSHPSHRALEVQSNHEKMSLIGALENKITSLSHCPVCPTCTATTTAVSHAELQEHSASLAKQSQIDMQANVAASAVSDKYKVDLNNDLRVLLESIAINREVLVAVSNRALISSDGSYGMLKTWIDGVK